jgi:hypothetical protein
MSWKGSHLRHFQRELFFYSMSGAYSPSFQWTLLWNGGHVDSSTYLSLLDLWVLIVRPSRWTTREVVLYGHLTSGKVCLKYDGSLFAISQMPT